MKRSRINHKLQQQTERNMILVIGGVVVVLLLILFFGFKLLVNFSLFVEKKADTQDTQEQASFIIPPIFDPITPATNSASLDVSGTAGSGKYIVVYINGKQQGKADIKNDGSFVFRDLTLGDGNNDIKAKAVDESEKESKFSSIAHVTYSIKAPELTVDFPSDGQTYHKDNNPLKVHGKTHPDVKVTINDFWAVTDNDGNYSYNLPLQGGDNEIKIVATDAGGNKTEKSLKVSYSE